MPNAQMHKCTDGMYSIPFHSTFCFVLLCLTCLEWHTEIVDHHFEFVDVDEVPPVDSEELEFARKHTQFSLAWVQVTPLLLPLHS